MRAACVVTSSSSCLWTELAASRDAVHFFEQIARSAEPRVAAQRKAAGFTQASRIKRAPEQGMIAGGHTRPPRHRWQSRDRCLARAGPRHESARCSPPGIPVIQLRQFRLRGRVGTFGQMDHPGAIAGVAAKLCCTGGPYPASPAHSSSRNRAAARPENPSRRARGARDRDVPRRWCRRAGSSVRRAASAKPFGTCSAAMTAGSSKCA
jgi:hypothetical protein